MDNKEGFPNVIQVHSTDGEFPDMIEVTKANAQAAAQEDEQ